MPSVAGRNRAVATFEAIFDRRPSFLARAPGRVNLIGEHTDYNDGFVLPMALDRATWVALEHRHDGLVKLVADDLGATGEFALDELTSSAVGRGGSQAGSSWLDYPRGVAWSLAADGHDLRGFNGVIASDVPRGAGLSSSAALELAVAAAFLLSDSGGGRSWDVRRVARAMKRTENEWIGVSSGIMDQLIGAAAVAGHALLIDCRDLELTPIALPSGVTVAVLDTGTRRGLVGSAYNERRASCERVAAALDVPALRDVDDAGLARASGLDPVDRRRAAHVVAENRRTVEAAVALSAGDVEAAGELMNQSHVSLRDLFEVSSEALDAMVAAAQAAPGCLGARMTGAGFGGCAVALVIDEEFGDFAATSVAAYEANTGSQAEVFRSAAGEGATAVRL